MHQSSLLTTFMPNKPHKWEVPVGIYPEPFLLPRRKLSH